MNVGDFLVLKKNVVEMIEIQIRLARAIDRRDACFLDDFVGILAFVNHRAWICHDERLLPIVGETIRGV